MGSSTFSKPWRPFPENNEDILEFLNSYKPQNQEANHLRILFLGPVGAGKSTLINSIDSVLQHRVIVRGLTDAISGKSFTRKYKTYKFSKGSQGHYSFVCNDIMGMEQKDGGVHVEDIKLALRGHVKDDYEFKPQQQLTKSDERYRSCPSLNDRVHVLVTVVPAGSVSILSEEVVKKLRKVRLAAREMDIPQLAILTKVDEACPKAKQDPKNIYKSKYLKEQVEKFSQLLGFSVNCIFLVKNYSSEISIDDDTDAHILCALKQMILHGNDFLTHLND
ncbi:interferon-induced protein 44-like isoform X2 [Oreochromis niloticus]|uniref:Interferon-induced protein 44-like n=1 Tax=Oreochromis niloticus TaxID=8128 RepID=A0A669EBQ1_ORENI|nr:interferon-induced protein 44-like isoform X2 [Oreochromis niloticus]XP_019213525.1 interferon-induced protein 44-like isoform X2 [Oreochromis niloticus]